MIARRYSKLPSDLLPKGTLSPSLKLSFDFNVAMLGNLAEKKAYDEATGKNYGPITNRAQARAAADEARRDVWEMEEEKRTTKKRA